MNNHHKETDAESEVSLPLEPQQLGALLKAALDPKETPVAKKAATQMLAIVGENISEQTRAEHKPESIVKSFILTQEKRAFAANILLNLVAYIVITFWLNAIRATASLWFVWTLIIIQIILYILLFTSCSLRAKTCGLKHFSFIIFTALAILGRVNNWEILVIPSMIIVVLIISARTKNISKERQQLVPGDY